MPNYLDMPIKQFEKMVSTWSYSKLKSGIKDIYEWKSYNKRCTDKKKIMNIERKETILQQYLNWKGYLKEDDNRAFMKMKRNAYGRDKY